MAPGADRGGKMPVPSWSSGAFRDWLVMPRHRAIAPHWGYPESLIWWLYIEFRDALQFAKVLSAVLLEALRKSLRSRHRHFFACFLLKDCLRLSSHGVMFCWLSALQHYRPSPASNRLVEQSAVKSPGSRRCVGQFHGQNWGYCPSRNHRLASSLYLDLACT